MRIILLVLVFAGAGLPVSAGAQTIAENITRFHPGCTLTANYRGTDCVAAAHRLCEANYSRNSFGFPYQRDGRLIYVACAVRGWYGDVPYARLRQLHPDCRGAADGQTTSCVAAVRRYCANDRSLPAGLVQEVGPESAAVACFAPTRFVDVAYGALPACRSGAAGSFGCITAASIWCRNSSGRELGLPQEIGPASVAVACVSAATRVVDVLSAPSRIDD